MNIFVGNLSKEATEADLEKLFSAFGQVKSSKVIRDIFSGTSKGFGFVEMVNKNEAQTAIKELNTADLKGQKITVNEARPKTDDRRGGGQNRRPGGGGGFNRSSFGGNRR
jgi:RNA recognition motif-containing protein